MLHYASGVVYRFMAAFQGNSGRIARFGVYELDLAAGELRKSGAKLRLQEQPFQVLALLLERAGDVVTREELRQKLWPADTFVDFDHSLNTAVNKLRETLGDSASSPRYIETLARRGYRFIAPVQTDARQGGSGAEVSSAGSLPAANLHPSMKTGAPVHRYFCGDADRLLFALEAHKVCPDSAAPSERRSRRARMTSS